MFLGGVPRRWQCVHKCVRVGVAKIADHLLSFTEDRLRDTFPFFFRISVYQMAENRFAGQIHAFRVFALHFAHESA